MMSKGCTLVLLSCDSRRDIWRPSFSLFERYWHDCHFPKLFVGETKGPGRQAWREFHGGKVPWSDLLAAALATVETEFVLLTLDDFMLTARVDTSRILRLFEAGTARGAQCIRLKNQPAGSPCDSADFDVDDNPRFRISHQAAFWKTETLKALLVPGETCWQMEAASAERSAAIPPGTVLVVKKTALPYLDTVQAGKWRPQGRNLARTVAPVDTQYRKVINWTNA